MYGKRVLRFWKVRKKYIIKKEEEEKKKSDGFIGKFNQCVCMCVWKFLKKTVILFKSAIDE